MTAPLLLNPGDPPVWVGEIPETIALPIIGACRDVHLTDAVYRHILERRLQDGDAQVALVLQRMAYVVASPTHVGQLTQDPRRIELYARLDHDPAGVCVSIKCLGHEAWINTAFPIGTRRYTVLVRGGRLTAVGASTATETVTGTVAVMNTGVVTSDRPKG